jgi:hypothetical protein
MQARTQARAPLTDSDPVRERAKVILAFLARFSPPLTEKVSISEPCGAWLAEVLPGLHGCRLVRTDRTVQAAGSKNGAHVSTKADCATSPGTARPPGERNARMAKPSELAEIAAAEVKRCLADGAPTAELKHWVGKLERAWDVVLKVLINELSRNLPRERAEALVAAYVGRTISTDEAKLLGSCLTPGFRAVAMTAVLETDVLVQARGVIQTRREQADARREREAARRELRQKADTEALAAFVDAGIREPGFTVEVAAERRADSRRRPGPDRDGRQARAAHHRGSRRDRGARADGAHADNVPDLTLIGGLGPQAGSEIADIVQASLERLTIGGEATMDGMTVTIRADVTPVMSSVYADVLVTDLAERGFRGYRVRFASPGRQTG